MMRASRGDVVGRLGDMSFEADEQRRRQRRVSFISSASRIPQSDPGGRTARLDRIDRKCRDSIDQSSSDNDSLLDRPFGLIT
jgi:hypothetical protein